MARGYDTEAVLEMLSDMETDNGIDSDSVYSDSNSDSICSYDEIDMNSYFEESEDESVSMDVGVSGYRGMDVGVSGYSGRVAVRGLGQQMSRGGSGNRGRDAGRGQQRRGRGAGRGQQRRGIGAGRGQLRRGRCAGRGQLRRGRGAVRGQQRRERAAGRGQQGRGRSVGSGTSRVSAIQYIWTPAGEGMIILQ